MKKVSLALFVSLLTLSGAGFAQSQTPSPTSEITESTDPARADQVMRRAEEIKAQQQASRTEASSGTSDTGKKAGKHAKSRKSMKSKRSGGGASGASGSSEESGTSR